MINDEVVIHIKEDKSVRLEITENGKTRTKLISPQTLFDCIKDSLSSTPVKVASGLLPSNIISVTGDESGARYAVVEYLYETADITYMSTEYKDFPLPRLIFGFKVENSGRVSDVKLGVPALGKLSPDTKMYYYPFSNVSYFHLCTGTNALPNIKTLQNLENLPSYILSLPDNDDHYDDEHTKLKLGHRDLLEHLRDKDRQYYYDKILVPMPGVTLKTSYKEVKSMTEEQAKKLALPFTFDEIEWRVLRVSKRKPVAQVAAYVDSRAIQKRLDEVVGRENWQNEFETVTGVDNKSTAHICKLRIYYPERGEWITKSDGAGCTDVEPIKGGLSNAFKRSASMWGIGRYLYELKNIWAGIDEYKCIEEHEYPELERKYNQFLKNREKNGGQAQKQTGQKKQNKQQPAQQAPTASQQSAPNPQQQQSPTPNIPNGRFAGNTPSATPGLKKNECKIVDLQVTKGAKSEQTFVVLQNCQGKKLEAYIQGTPQLSNGQIICSPKIVTKSHPAFGNYNIIESYNLAA